MSSGIGRAVKSRRHGFAIQRAQCAERPAARLLSSGQLIEVGLEMAARRKAGSKTTGDAVHGHLYCVRDGFSSR